MKIIAGYYAALREWAGRDEEPLETSAQTVADLYAELKARYGFALEPSQLRVAINDAFVPFDSVLARGDYVVFIPPISGG